VRQASFHLRILLAIPLAVAVMAAPAGSAAPGAPVPPQRALYTDAPSGLFLLSQGWTTRADPRDVGIRDGWQREDALEGFEPVTVPNAFNARDLSRASFAGRVQWYRTSFTTPPSEDAVAWRVRFESVNVDATVWLNGKRIGRHRGAYLPFERDARSLRPGANELVVRVDSRGSPGDLPPANRPRGWWNFGGILREVYLRAVHDFDVTNLRVTARPGHAAIAHVTATVRNAGAGPSPLTIRSDIHGPGGFESTEAGDEGVVAPGESRRVAVDIPIPGAKLWTPQQPNLYELSVDVPGGQRTTAHFGVRRWSVTRGGRIALNGRPLALRGASFHEQTAAHGAALTPVDRDTLVQELERTGANFARAHYPPHPALLEAFDRAGIVYWEQIPVWRVRAQQLRDARFRATALATLKQAVVRDRNHASVLAWSVSNETLRGGSGETKYLRSARRLVRRLDPTRLLAADKSLKPLDDLPRSYRALDAIGLNEYVGWYGGRTVELPGDLAAVHRRFPRQALLITEFGAEANRTGPLARKGTYAFQRRFLADHLSVFDRTTFLSGALVWVLRDCAIRPGWTGGNPRPRPPVLFKGLFSESGRAKPALAAVRARFRAAIRR
jgi:beta-glucuronidase